MAARLPRIDALRGFAVFGIMLVNIWGFVYGYALHGFPVREAVMPLADQAAVFFVAAFAEQKFYPIFAFLFGAGFALQTGRRRAPGPALDEIRTIYLRRLRWLLAVGLLHATLLWFGDILTAYALTGFWLAYKAGRPLRDILFSLRFLAVVNAIIIAAYGLMVVAWTALPLEEMIAQVIDAERAHAIYTQGGWGDIALRRLKDFGVNVMGYAIFLPRIAFVFILGAYAARRGWLTRPERHRALWRSVMLAGFAVGIPLNLWFGAVAVLNAADPIGLAPHAGLATALTDVAGPLLGAAYVALFMLMKGAPNHWLGAAGRMALTNYLMQSLLLMLLLQGFALGLGAHVSRAGLMGVAAAIMALQLVLSRWWMSLHRQGPIEALWRRYIYKQR